MRKIYVLGTAAAALAFGAFDSAAYADNPNVPSWSPYALAAVPPTTATMGETRAAFVEPGIGAQAPNASNPNVPSWSPYTLLTPRQ